MDLLEMVEALMSSLSGDPSAIDVDETLSSLTEIRDGLKDLGDPKGDLDKATKKVESLESQIAGYKSLKDHLVADVTGKIELLYDAGSQEKTDALEALKTSDLSKLVAHSDAVTKLFREKWLAKGDMKAIKPAMTVNPNIYTSGGHRV